MKAVTETSNGKITSEIYFHILRIRNKTSHLDIKIEKLTNLATQKH
jgi:hypothetical protein